MKKNLLIALVIDVLIHLLLFKPMANHISQHGLNNLSWWNAWIFKWFFSNHSYPASSLDPATHLFGNNAFNMLVIPYLIILFFVYFGRDFMRLVTFAIKSLLSFAKTASIAIFVSLNELISTVLPSVHNKMKWLRNWLYEFIGYVPKTDTSKGSSRFAIKREIQKFLRKKYHGLLIDGTRRIKQSLSVRHVAIIAPSGQGKTTNYVIPNVLGLPEFINPKTKLPASMAITDPKGELYALTSKYLKDQGYNIKIIEVDKPHTSEHFNPLKRANTDKELAKVAQIIVESGLPDAKSGDFWVNSAKMLLTTILKIVKRSVVPEEHQNLHNVKRFVDLMGGDGKSLLDFVLQCTDPNAITEYASFVEQQSETLSNILLTLKAALKDLASDEICQLTKDDTLDFESLRNEKTVLYIVTPFSDIEYYRFILTILYSQIFSFCDKVDKGHDIIFMLDEFGNLGKIPAFPQLITTLRSKGCSVSIILQDIEQLRMVYGKSGSSTIINGGCSSKIFFGGIQNMETLQEVSKMLGTKTLEQKTSDGKELSPIARPLMLPDEINKMKIGTGLFLSAGQYPVKISMKQYSDTRLKKRVQKDKDGNVIAVPKPKYDNAPVQYFPFDSYTETMVED